MNTLRILDLMPMARNVVVHGAVRPGEIVTILTDTLVPDLVAEAVLAALIETGARPMVVTSEPPGLRWRTGYEPPAPMRAAVYGADVVVQLKSVEAQAYPRLQETSCIEHGVRWVKVPAANQPEVLASPFARFPYDVMQLMARKVFEQWTRGARVPGPAGKTIRVAAANGTDLTATYDPRYVINTGFVPAPLRPGQWNQLCGATVGIELFTAADGVVVLDALHGEEEYKFLPPVGSDVVYPLSQPIRWIFEGKYAAIEGGPEADVMRRIVSRAGTRAARALCEIALGVNPKAPLNTLPTRHAGVTHYAIGSTRGRTPTTELEDAPVHTHGHIHRATIEVDGDLTIDNGRLLALDDPEVRDAASRHGDPDEILAEVPF